MKQTHNNNKKLKEITKKGVVALSLFATLQGAYGSQVVPKFVKLNKEFKINPSSQAFCYRDRTGELYGHNTHEKVTIASVSKLITSLWAIEEMGADYRYPTKFYLKDKKLHISGSLDPVYSHGKLFFLLAQLNNQGITELEEITFDKNLRIYTKAERYLGNILNVTPARTAANLKDFWNTPTWNKLKPFYNDFANMTPQSLKDHLSLPDTWEGFNMKVGKVSVVEKNPLGEDGLLHLSPKMERYLKFTNIVSNNYIADQIFEKLGGEEGFDKYFKKISKDFAKSSFPEKEGSEPLVKMYSGSGLDSKRDGKRVDNYSTCAMTLELVDRLHDKLEDQQVAIQEVVAVPGTDLGTFRNRLRSPRLDKTFVAKTGTLFHTSAIAGILFGVKSKVTFGIFHQLTGWKGGAKMVQNKTIESLWETYAPNEKFDYEPQYFFPADQPLEAMKKAEAPEALELSKAAPKVETVEEKKGEEKIVEEKAAEETQVEKTSEGEEITQKKEEVEVKVEKAAAAEVVETTQIEG